MFLMIMPASAMAPSKALEALVIPVLAEARDIKVREYQIIYNLVDDVKAALEGQPHERGLRSGRRRHHEGVRGPRERILEMCPLDGTLPPPVSPSTQTSS